jgi:hypothetical protein
MTRMLACALVAGAAMFGMANPAAAVPAAPVAPMAAQNSPSIAGGLVEQVRTVCYWRHHRRICSWQPGRHRGWGHRGWRHGRGHRW